MPASFKQLALAFAVLSLAATPCAEAASALEQGFRDPPQSARPRAWWHWMNGNITERGIKLDLEWMKKVGLGGVVAIDASIDTPTVVEKRLVYMSPEWKHAFLTAVRQADKMNMEFGIDSSPGWSETGGPWVKPEQGMKKLVWSTTALRGGVPFHGVLPQPPSNIGPYQNAPIYGDEPPAPKIAGLTFYRDSIVIAYRVPLDGEATAAITSNAGPVDAATLSDGDVANGPALKAAADDADVWVLADFGKPVAVQGMTLALSLPKQLGYKAGVEASDNAKDWRGVADVSPAASVQRMRMLQQTISFAPVKARYFRLVLHPAQPLPVSARAPNLSLGVINARKPQPYAARVYHVHELVFHQTATVHDFESKAHFSIPAQNFYDVASPRDIVPGSAIDPKTVVDLSARMKPDGRLDWTPPAGRWVLLRLGYSLTGAQNHPATAEATGLEVDKLNRDDVRSYMEQYLDSYASFTGPQYFGRRGLQSVTVDSSEIGLQNWTGNLLSEFKRLRGYDPTPWLPALTGAVVGSPGESDKFLWDFRRTIEDLYAPNHYGEIAAVARERGLINYGESFEGRRPTIGEDMASRQYTSIPMAALWSYDGQAPLQFTNQADILGAASVAHVYGQNLVAAESLTSGEHPWAYGPGMLRPMVDLEFVRGVNRVVLHSSVHQPIDKAPGLSLFGYGQFFNRLENWAPLARPWISYIARTSYLLQQGRFAADIAYFYGEESPILSLFGSKEGVDVPQGYGFDFVNTDVLINQLSVETGMLVSKTGMHYRLLYLGGTSRMMTLKTLRRLRDLVAQGAVVVGSKPEASPSLADDAAEFASVADDLFGKDPGSLQRYGEGRIYSSFSEALAGLLLRPDFDYAKSQPGSQLLYLHRHIPDGEIYFISNRQNHAERTTARFRVTGLTPEIWDAVTGSITPVAFTPSYGYTKVELNLPANASTFVVFRAKPVRPVPVQPTTLTTLQGPWQIAFQPNRGAPARIVQDSLQSWSQSPDAGVKYFSGAATYSKTFTLPRNPGKSRILLDLGEVREVAEVTLNGKPVGSAWVAPYRLDITKALKPGNNTLAIKVANLWVNRLIGDAQPGAAAKYTFTTIPTYRADAPLRPSGLLGPVTLLQLK
jgi:hypothetical protein